MEENTAAIASLISKAIINLGQGITSKLSEIRGEMVANFQEISNLRTEIDNFRNNLNALDKDIENFRHEFTRLQDNVKNSLQLSSQQITSQVSSQISNLQSQINQLASRPVVSSSSSSGEGGIDIDDYNKLVKKSNKKSEIVNNFTKELNSCLSRGGSSSEITKIVQDFIDSVDLVFCDPQYEKVSNVLKMDYPLYPQSDYQIMRIIEQVNRVLKPSSFCLLWINKEESSLPTSQRKHPHQKPRELIKALVSAMTQQGDLIVDPCAGSFIVLEVCQELKRNYCGVDLTFREMGEFLENKT
ncbi:43643_t:CDS:2 [Gigaspora margarita]|uniref:43643_t:CDS:1 n=1 Tax=Gigaspora margarita TaxID=4874 RepID=A0ABN7UYJ1_GIGMA|nr:43643_t:CDS:2 [Gigaspora margarita]